MDQQRRLGRLRAGNADARIEAADRERVGWQIIATGLKQRDRHFAVVSQLIRKGPYRLIVRLQAQAATNADEVWARASRILRDLRDRNGLGNVIIERSPDAPTPISKSGKLRQVWSEPA